MIKIVLKYWFVILALFTILGLPREFVPAVGDDEVVVLHQANKVDENILIIPEVQSLEVDKVDLGYGENEMKISFNSRESKLFNLIEKPEENFTRTIARRSYSNSEYDHWFEKYGSEYGVSSKTLKGIAYCESNFRSSVISGPYGGMYQYLASTWSSTRRTMGMDEDPTLRFNPEEAIRTTAFKIASGGIGAWPVCGKRMLARI